MVTISCALRYSVSGRSTGTLISTLAPAWSVPSTRSVSRGSAGSGKIRGTGILAGLSMVLLDSMTFRTSGYKAPRWQSGWQGVGHDMKVIGLAGWSGAGKTTLLRGLIPYFRDQGLSVSVIKHAHH